MAYSAGELTRLRPPRPSSRWGTAVSEEPGMRPPREGPIDPDAFEGLVEEYADRLYSLALRITGSEEDAHDAVQDTYLSAFRQRAQFRGDADVGTWLYRIAVNAALQRVRARRPVETL